MVAKGEEEAKEMDWEFGVSRASVMVKQVKNPPAIQETQEMWIRFWAGEDHLEKEIATHSSILAWKIPWTEEPHGYSLKGRKESDRTEN